MFFKKSLVVAVLSIVSMMVCATSTQAQNFAGTAIPVPSSVSFIDHRVMPGESCELITRRYYGVEDAGLLLPDNPWLAPRPVWTKSGLSFRIHPGEYIRIRWAGSPIASQPQQQPIQIIESSFTSTPAFWIGFGILTIMLIVLSIIIGILWKGRRDGQVFVQQAPPAPAQAVAHHHTHAYPPMSLNVSGHVTHEQVGVAPVAPVAPSPAPAGPDAPAGGGVQNQGARSPVGFKSEKECGQGKG